MSETTSTPTFKPPYMAFQTLWNFLGELAEKPLPPQIDRSLMNSKSGTDQANLVAAMRSFELIDEQNVVQEALKSLTDHDVETRKARLADLVRHYYAPALKVSEINGTETQLRDVFRDTFQISSADTQRKAVTFFLHAARYAGIEVSSHFPQTRAGQGGPGAPRSRRSPTRRKSPKGEPAFLVPPPPPPSGRSEKTVTLATGGTMTLIVSVDPLTLRGEERSFFFQVVDLLDEYAVNHPLATEPVA